MTHDMHYVSAVVYGAFFMAQFFAYFSSHLTKKLVSDKGIIESLRRRVQERKNEVCIGYSIPMPLTKPTKVLAMSYPYHNQF